MIGKPSKLGRFASAEKNDCLEVAGAENGMAGSFSERLFPRRGVLAEVETTPFDIEPHICHLIGLCCFETLLQQRRSSVSNLLEVGST